MREQSQTIEYEDFPSEYRRGDNYRRFTLAIREAMEGGLLRYSRRMKLLELADELGIERFDANLIIAQVQRRVLKDKSSVGTGDGLSAESVNGENREKSLREKFFTAAAIFLLAALTDLVLIRYLFGS